MFPRHHTPHPMNEPTRPTRIATRIAIAIVATASPTAFAQFNPPQNVNLGVGIAPNALTGIASGDINGDTFGDVLGVDNAIAGNIGVAMGLAGGTYAAIPVVSGPLPVTAGGMTLPVFGDFDLDGFLDVAMAGSVGGIPTVFVARANPASPGAYIMPALPLPLIGGPGTITGLRVTDVTADGDQDILASVIGPNRRINTIPGAGGLTFGPMTSSTTMTGPEDIDICVDVSNDNMKDVVVCGLDQGTSQAVVEVLRGDNLGHFTAPLVAERIFLPPGQFPIDVTWIDCNQDKEYDILIACQGIGAANSNLFKVINSGSPPFFSNAGLQPPTPLPQFPSSVIRLEANFDGVEDVSALAFASVSGVTTTTSVAVFNSLNCALAAPSVSAGGTVNPSALNQDQFGLHAVHDQDFDGREDLIVGDQTGTQDRVLVYKNVGPTDFTLTPVRPLLGQTTPITFRLQAPAALQGSPFIILFTANGTQPGVDVGPFHFPLNPLLLPITLPGTLGSGGLGIVTTPPITFDKKPVGFSAQIACAAIVTTAVQPIKVMYISKPAVITVP